MRDLNITQTIITIIIIYSLFILQIINSFIIRNSYFTFYNKRVTILVGAITSHIARGQFRGNFQNRGT